MLPESLNQYNYKYVSSSASKVSALQLPNPQTHRGRSGIYRPIREPADLQKSVEKTSKASEKRAPGTGRRGRWKYSVAMQGRPAAMILAMVYLLLFSFFFLRLSFSAHGANLPAAAGDALPSAMAHRRLLRSMMLQHSYVPDETTMMIQQLLGPPSPRPQPGNVEDQGGVSVSPAVAAAAEQTPKMAPAPPPRGPTTADLITDDRPGRGEVDIGVDYTPPKTHPPQHN